MRQNRRLSLKLPPRRKSRLRRLSLKSRNSLSLKHRRSLIFSLQILPVKSLRKTRFSSIGRITSVAVRESVRLTSTTTATVPARRRNSTALCSPLPRQMLSQIKLKISDRIKRSKALTELMSIRKDIRFQNAHCRNSRARQWKTLTKIRAVTENSD